MTTLALVESPGQLLHVLEWCHATGSAGRTTAAVLAPREATGRLQLQSMLGYAEEEGLAVRWFDPRRNVSALLSAVVALRPLLSAAERLVVGDPFSGLVQLLLPAYRGNGLVVVDDGTATLEFVTRLGQGAPLARWDADERGIAAWLRRPLATRARGLLAPGSTGSITVFTVMPVTRLPGIVVHPNRYDWTRRRFGQPPVQPGTDIVGSSLVESGVVDPDAYLDVVAGLTSGAPGRYYAHRREGDGKLDRIAAATGLQVVRPRVPLEVELRRGPVAEQVVTFPSSVGYTLPVVLEAVDASVRMVPIEPSWLRDGVGSRARQFLTSIVDQAQLTAARRPAESR